MDESSLDEEGRILLSRNGRLELQPSVEKVQGEVDTVETQCSHQDDSTRRVWQATGPVFLGSLYSATALLMSYGLVRSLTIVPIYHG